MDPTAPVIVTCRNKVFLAERVLIQRRECFDVPETWFYSIMKDWTPIPLRSPSVVQGEDCEDFNIPALISLVIKCYEVSRTMQATANQNTGSSAKPNLEGLKIPAPWSSGTNTIFICCKPIFWGLMSFFILCTICTVRYNQYTVFPLGVLYPEHSQPAFLTLAVICLVQIHFCYTKKYTRVFIKSMYTAKASLIKL